MTDLHDDRLSRLAPPEGGLTEQVVALTEQVVALQAQVQKARTGALERAEALAAGPDRPTEALPATRRRVGLLMIAAALVAAAALILGLVIGRSTVTHRPANPGIAAPARPTVGPEPGASRSALPAISAFLHDNAPAGGAVGVTGSVPGGLLTGFRQIATGTPAAVVASGVRYVARADPAGLATSPGLLAWLDGQGRVVASEPGRVVLYDVLGAVAPPGETTPAPTATAPTTVTVAANDSFWSIATSYERRALGRSPTVSEITRYWGTLIGANLARLAHPGNPDLIYPGQVLLLPSG